MTKDHSKRTTYKQNSYTMKTNKVIVQINVLLQYINRQNFPIAETTVIKVNKPAIN